MKAFNPVFRILISGAAFLTLAVQVQAAVLDWSTVTWSGTSRSYNVDGVAGNDITVAYTTANTVNFQNGTPAILSNLNGQGPVLGFDVSSLNTTGTITVTITFTGTYAAGATASFRLVDVDARFPGQPGGTNYFQDRITITALNGATPVPLTVTGGGEPVISGSGTTTPSALGQFPIGDGTGNVNVSNGSNFATRMSFTWSNPSTYTGTQLIGLGNITFTAIPEVASSTGALLLCGGLLAFRRRRGGREFAAQICGFTL